jgi:hypothetical protein
LRLVDDGRKRVFRQIEMQCIPTPAGAVRAEAGSDFSIGGSQSAEQELVAALTRMLREPPLRFFGKIDDDVDVGAVDHGCL